MTIVANRPPTIIEFMRAYVGIDPSVPQAAFLKTLAREPLDDAEREAFAVLFGMGADEPIADSARRVVFLLKGARVGGSLLCSTLTLWRALTAPLPDRRSGERVFVGFTSADVRLARESLAFVGAVLDRMPSLTPMVVSRSTEIITMRRPDGIVIVFQILPATPSAPRGRWFLDVVVSEADHAGAESGAAPIEEVVRSYASRLVRGGTLLAESTPWLEGGFWEKGYLANYGTPRAMLVCRAPTLFFYPTPETIALVAAETARDPRSAAREYGTTWTANGAAYFDAGAIDRAVDASRVLEIGPDPNRACGVGLDLAFKSDAAALVVVMRNVTGGVDVAKVEILSPAKGAPLVVSEVLSAFGRTAKAYGAYAVSADAYYVQSAAEHFARLGIAINVVGASAESKATAYARVRELAHRGKLSLPAGSPLVAELKAVTSRHVGQGQIRIESPRKAGKGHGDAAAAFVAACDALARTSASNAMHDEFQNLNKALRSAGAGHLWGGYGRD